MIDDDDDRSFLEAFENCSIGAGEFHHGDHIRLAWIYLRTRPLLDATGCFIASLQRFAAHHGVPQLYHATITWAYLLLIRDRMRDESSFAAFRAANPDLFAWKPSILDRYYSAPRLASPEARAAFLLPDVPACSVRAILRDP